MYRLGKYSWVSVFEGGVRVWGFEGFIRLGCCVNCLYWIIWINFYDYGEFVVDRMKFSLEGKFCVVINYMKNIE